MTATQPTDVCLTINRPWRKWRVVGPTTSSSALWSLEGATVAVGWGWACTPDAAGEPGPAGLVDEHVEAGEQVAALSGPQDGHDAVYERVAVLAAAVGFEVGHYTLICLLRQPRPQLAQVLLWTGLLLGCSLCPAPPPELRC